MMTILPRMPSSGFPWVYLKALTKFALSVLVVSFSLAPARAATGIDWTLRSAANNAADWKSIAYGNGLFVAVASGGTGSRVMTSPDGVNWTSQTAVGDEAWWGVTYGNGLFVAVSVGGTGSRVMTSPDGVTWTGRTAANTNGWNAVTYGNGLFVAVSGNGAGSRVMTSTDGITWTGTTGASSTWQGITYANGLYVAVADSGTRVMTSPDGLTWTTRSAPGSAWQSVTYAQGKYVAVGAIGAVMTSGDGITWASKTAASTNNWMSVTYGNNLFVAVGRETGSGNRVMTSPDGITWTSRTSPADYQWASVTYGNGRFVAVANSGTNRVMTSGTDCGDGLSFPTGQWQQFALPCVPSANPASLANVLANAPTANLPAATFGSEWFMYGRNATNTGNTALSTASTLTSGAGYWIKSYTAAVNGKLTVAGAAGTVTPSSSLTGCQSLVGCAVIPVSTTSAAARMIGNPFGYDVEWSQVRIRVGGSNGTIYTPTQAAVANILSNQIWIWNGSGSYDTWDDVVVPGNLQYSKSFFIRVLSSGVGQTIDLLIPATSSSLTVVSLPERIIQSLAQLPRLFAQNLANALVPSAAAAEQPGWRVRLFVENRSAGTKARAILGQYPGSQTGYDAGDLISLAPFSAPWLSLVFPHPDWGVKQGDYASDFRAFDGRPGQWLLELRADTPSSQVVVRWEGEPAILKRSRLVDKLTGRVVIPSSPANANGYTLTLNPAIRQLVWEFLGDPGPQR